MRARAIEVIAAFGLSLAALAGCSAAGEAQSFAGYAAAEISTANMDGGWPERLPAALYASPAGEAMRNSSYLYPLVNVVHVMGLVLVVGTIGLLDLRLLGLARQIPVAPAYRLLTAMAALGIVVQLTSGVMLFAAEATTLVNNDAFVLKMVLLAAALANAGLFRLLWRSRVGSWDEDPPVLGRAQAALSLLLWLSIAVLGRLIAYL